MVQKKIPQRKCTGCGEMFPKKELIRVLLTPENEVVIDLTGRMNGRGAYICKRTGCLEKAIKTKALSRSLGTNIEPEIYEKLKKELEDYESE